MINRSLETEHRVNQSVVKVPVFSQEGMDLITRIVTLSPSDPNYPFKKPFEDYYSSFGSGGEADYLKKYAVATALIDDGRYENIRFLRDKFVTSESQISPEVAELKDYLDQRARDVLVQRGDVKEIKKVEDELRSFVENVSEGQSLDAQRFLKLANLFGSSHIIDLLYKYRPEFKGLPVEQVKGVIADYIGDYIMIKGEFNPDDLEKGAQYLSDPNLHEGLFEVVKESCLSSYNYSKKAGSKLSDQEIIAEYFDILELETEALNSPLIQEVLDKAKEYYQSLFEIQKPEYIVDSLREGRDFPDINQLINIKEIMDKKRMLIADDMGLGKSASAILVKEILGLRQAIVVVPSNVISTWQSYLSDDRKKRGYFKEGSAPKVLVVDDIKKLQTEDMSTYQYILVSQEMLNGKHTEALTKLDYDMLVVDEVHKLKNLKGGKRAANLVKLSEKVEGEDKYLAVLSGTPVPNKVKDVAMILKLLYPEKFKDIQDNKLIKSIIKGDIVDLRSLLVPRMQMKSLKESIVMPELKEDIVEINLSDIENQVYEVLMDEDEITASEKIQILRQFLLNPDCLDATPGLSSSKISALQEKIDEAFQNKEKVVMFVNDYVEGVIRGDRSIFDYLKMPEGVDLEVIEGHVGREKREAIQRELKQKGRKIFLAVSGQTADVGVDFSGAESVFFYNEPWSQYIKDQELGREYREGLDHNLESWTFIVKNTIEEGINKYIKVKQRAVEKLLKGIPINELEKRLLRKAEKQSDDKSLEVNPELAEYYFSAWDRMLKIFSHVKELGEKDFLKFLSTYSREYADCYTDLGNRSYQANASRIAGTLIDTFVKERNQIAKNVRILDIASGPEMLKNHILENYRDKIVSVDINKHHFEGRTGSNRVVGSFLRLPFQDKSFDYANLSLALHYTKPPIKGNSERLQVLVEANRVLKEGGRLLIDNIYSIDLKDEIRFREIAHILGFKVVEHYTNEIVVGDTYRSHVYTLQKEKDIDQEFLDNTQSLAEVIGKENLDGIKFLRNKSKVKDSKRIIADFIITGTPIGIRFNKQDLEILQEERSIIDVAETLRVRYGSIHGIPREDILQNSFVRIKMGNKYVLFRRLEKGSGAVVIK